MAKQAKKTAKKTTAKKTANTSVTLTCDKVTAGGAARFSTDEDRDSVPTTNIYVGPGQLAKHGVDPVPGETTVTVTVEF